PGSLHRLRTASRPIARAECSGVSDRFGDAAARYTVEREMAEPAVVVSSYFLGFLLLTVGGPAALTGFVSPTAGLLAGPACAVATVLALEVVAPAALTVFVPPTPALPTGPACAVATVLLWPLVKAVPPITLLLIAMPGVVCMTVRPSVKAVPARVSGPGP